ncbi:MAG: ABC transporter permease subunit, partial [Clostridia bacterium]
MEFTKIYFDNPQKLLTRKDTDDMEKKSFFESFKESFTKTFITENRYQMILKGLLVTLQISVWAAVFGMILAFGICLMRRSHFRLLNIPAKLFVGIIQGTPIMVILMILFYIIFTSPGISPILVAIIGFSINFAAYASETMRAGIDAVDRGQAEAAAALGFSSIQ